jgi:hypothetical protein
MNLALANLNQLVRQRYAGTPAETAANQVLHASDEDLRRLLRHHRTQAITARQEIRLRDGFDDLLSFYGLVELGCVSSAFPDPLLDALFDHAREILGRGAVQAYYTQHYPLVLPGQFYQRLQANPSPVQVSSSDGIGAYFELLDTIAILDDDENVDSFLHLLDDYWFGSFSLATFVDLLDVPEGFVECLLQAPEGAMGRSVHGFRTFLVFCLGFDRLLTRLARSSTTSLLVRPFWGASEYWFRVLKNQLGAELGRGVGIVESWGNTPAPPGHARSDLHGVLNRLATCNYTS